MSVRSRWHSASVPVLTPLWWSGVVCRRRSPSVIITTWRPRRTSIPSSVHRTIVVAVTTEMRPLRIPLIGTHTDGTSSWSRWQVRFLFLTSSARVEFVTVLVSWQVLGSGWYRVNLEIFVLQCVECVDAFLVVQTQQAFQEIKTFRLKMSSKALIDVTPLLIPVLDSFASRQEIPARHVGFVW